MIDVSRTKLYTQPEEGTLKSRSVTTAMRKLERWQTGQGDFPSKKSLKCGVGGRVAVASSHFSLSLAFASAERRYLAGALCICVFV